VGELAAIAPFVLAVLASWTLEYPAHKAMRENLAAQAVPEGSEVLPVWTRRQFLTYNIRHNLLFMLVPIGLIIFLEDALVLYLRPFLTAAFADEIIMAATVVMAGAVFLAAPFLIVRIWRTSPLGPGPLRDELEAMGRELNLRFRDILIWHSDGVIANAGVLGLLGRARYVLLSDLLLKNMSAEHIRAIFAHEAGHVIHRHIPYSVLFFAGAGAISMTSATALADLLRWSDWLAEATGLLLLAPCVVVVFGWISRRFERQSDVTAAWLADRGDAGDADRVTPEGSAIFAGALQRVALLNGISPHQPNWRHGSIAWRVAYMFSLGQTGGSRRGISRLVARVKLALWALVLAAVAVVAWQAIADRLTQTPRQERPVHAPVNVVLPPRDVAHNQPHRERGERR
jgi:STE24 endopeptidase